MLNKWKKHFIQTQKGAYKNATLEKIDTHWLIFDSETEEAFSFTPETFADFEIKGYLKAVDEWVSLQYYSEQYLQADEKLLPVTENMPFRIQTRLPFAYEAWLAKLTHEQLLKITQFLNDLHYSLFDCLYCHNTDLFMDTTDGTGVNFIFFTMDASLPPYPTLFIISTKYLQITSLIFYWQMDKNFICPIKNTPLPKFLLVFYTQKCIYMIE